MCVKCDLCDAEATVHETQIVGGKPMVRHLCERHAAEVGLTGTGPVPATPATTTVVLSLQRQAGATLRCPSCQLSYAAFRQHGLLGCAGCYEAFEERLSPLIERAHQGGTHHIGKTPRRMLAAAQEQDPQAVERLLGSARERAERVALLRKQLEEALAQEQYERAAALRDELRRCEAQHRAASAGAPDAGTEARGQGQRDQGQHDHDQGQGQAQDPGPSQGGDQGQGRPEGQDRPGSQEADGGPAAGGTQP